MKVLLREFCEERVLQQLNHERSIVRVLFQALCNKVIEILAPVGWSIESRWWISHDLEHGPGGMHFMKRWVSISNLNGENTQGPDISPTAIDLVIGLSWNRKHFGSHPIWRANASAQLSHGGLKILGQAKVTEFNLSLAGNKDIASSNVPMHDVVFVKIHNHFGHFPENVRDLLLRHSSANSVHFLDQVHDGTSSTKLQHKPYLIEGACLFLVDTQQIGQIRVTRMVSEYTVFLLDFVPQFNVVDLNLYGHQFAIGLSVNGFEDLD